MQLAPVDTRCAHYPAPFNVPVDLRPGPFDLPQDQRSSAFRNVETDVDSLYAAFGKIPPLSAPGPIVWLQGPDARARLPGDLGKLRRVQKDTVFALAVRDNEALCVSDLAKGVILTARGTDAQGRTVVAVLYRHSKGTPAEVLTAMWRAMAAMGVGQYKTMVLGGELARLAAFPNLDYAQLLAAAAHREKTLVCGRLGVTQSPRSLIAQARMRGDILPAWPGLPDTPVCAVLTAEHLYYAAHDERGATLFDERRVEPVGKPAVA
jgi:hypothetical protein